ncbi:sulfatase [Lentisphaera marina]|uniref:sulfatase n=1 Tax=Lentisphaera marina TaxID=1111041 RepID=UPI0023665D4C|nr:sulfatase [Lentisphaera marina]MDD7984300.1 sulfatase [Lentisphaera marina]
MKLNLRSYMAFLIWIMSLSLFASEKNNFLFIIVDDLRPELGCYGNKQVISPNIDRLASQGTMFSKAYCNVPVCGASRASVMTGLRPTKDRFIRYNARAHKESGGVTDLAGIFKNNGYTTISIGKVYHERDDYLSSWTHKDSPLITSPSMRDYHLPENQVGRGKYNFQPLGASCEAADEPDEKYFTHQLADAAIDYIDKTEKKQKPWFLAVGFTKPHLPFVAPKKYWDYYKRSDFKLASNPEMPKNSPREARHEWHELRKMYNDIPQTGPVPDEKALELKHGYYACVSFTDAMIGRILDHLDKNNLRKNTTVVLWGDHGWQLGEHGLWCKHANFETSLNTPLIVSAAGQKAAGPSKALVEFVDIYPSLCDLANFDKPSHLEGRSFAPLLKNPRKKWKSEVFSRYHAGDSIHTDRFLYTEWRNNNNGNVSAKMLYDHQRDPNENYNIAGNPEYAEVVKKLSTKLQSHINSWK